jgi:putative acetyltransferase
MIRSFASSDMDNVLDIWLEASAKAHTFVEREFWESKIEHMRKMYIPISETYVFSDNDTVKGFFCLYEDTLAALFVSPDYQGKGIGKQLLNKAKSLRKKLNLLVYQENTRSVEFYRKSGFTTMDERIEKSTGHIELLMEYSPKNVKKS